MYNVGKQEIFAKSDKKYRKKSVFRVLKFEKIINIYTKIRRKQNGN